MDPLWGDRRDIAANKPFLKTSAGALLCVGRFRITLGID